MAASILWIAATLDVAVDVEVVEQDHAVVRVAFLVGAGIAALAIVVAATVLQPQEAAS
ncbi:MAG TPA: hypothetical protein VFN18_08985 [Solirubrobacterales bacterium]|nr:hypothetical protein [Solirubrobacterales bacterium]